MKVAVIGGGASGFFSAIRCKEQYPEASVTLFEKSNKVLSKVKISGGGRCNVTNSEENIKEFATNYPRGKNQLKKLFGRFGAVETRQWFESRGVELVTQEDKCIFPKSQNSQTIIDCLLKECHSKGIMIEKGHHLSGFSEVNEQHLLEFRNGYKENFDKVIFCLGGLPNPNQYSLFKNAGYEISKPVPSLYTFNMPNNKITKLMGVVVNPATVKVLGTKLIDNGPLLITHWGMSGPAVLKTSAWGARVLEEQDYNFTIKVNWLNDWNEEKLRNELNRVKSEGGKKTLKNFRLKEVPSRLWEFILEDIEMPQDMIWQGVNKKQLNRLIDHLINDVYNVKGKTTFKEEFVTCGGISLSNINMKTMESKLHSGIYFAGEFIDIDGITGGFNFQSAWTTGYVAGELK